MIKETEHGQSRMNHETYKKHKDTRIANIDEKKIKHNLF